MSTALLVSWLTRVRKTSHTMKVSELIEQLKALPQEAVVHVWDTDEFTECDNLVEATEAVLEETGEVTIL
jgi:hypothetical protein